MAAAGLTGPTTDATTWGPLAELRGGPVTLTDTELRAAASASGHPESELFAALRADRARAPSVLVFRQQTGILGSGAPEWMSLPKSLRDELTGVTPTTTKAASGTVAAGKTASGTTSSGTTSAEKASSTENADPTGVGSQVEYILPFIVYYVARDDGDLGRQRPRRLPRSRTRTTGRCFCDIVLKGVGPGPVVLRDGPGHGASRQQRRHEHEQVGLHRERTVDRAHPARPRPPLSLSPSGARPCTWTPSGSRWRRRRSPTLDPSGTPRWSWRTGWRASPGSRAVAVSGRLAAAPRSSAAWSQRSPR